jgi:MFS family permease
VKRSRLSALILASALITFDGTATTLALPAIGHDLSAPVARLQWITNASLLVLAALLLPAGSFADRIGRIRAIRVGLVAFAAASLASALANTDAWLIGARLALGGAASLILPAALAVLRGSYADAAERARVLGTWAAWTGVAGAAGPLLAGAFVDLASWRAVFVTSAAVAVVALVLLRAPVGSEPTHGAPPAAALSQIVRAHNCMPANASAFAMYFGMFGLSFVLTLYTQQVLRYSGLWAAVVLLPISLMLLLAERFGRLTARVGTRAVIASGACVAAAGIGWVAIGSHPLPFWSHLILGTSIFGLGISVAVSALTHAAVAAVPTASAGAASGLNHAVVRAAGLFAVALLGSVAAPGFSEHVSPDGVQRALAICAVVVAAGGAGGGVCVRDDRPGGLTTAA